MSSKVSTPRAKSKRQLPQVPDMEPDSENNLFKHTPNKSVKFNPLTVETSIGGTSTPGKIRSSLPLTEKQEAALAGALKKANLFKTPERKNSKPPAGPRRSEPMTGYSPATPAYRKDDNSKKSGPKTPLRRFTLDNKLPSTPECFNPVSIGTPVTHSSSHGNYHHSKLDDSMDENSSVTVAVRVRPFSQRELLEPNVKCVVSMNDNETHVTDEKGVAHAFTYDYSFSSFDAEEVDYADQEHCYNALAAPLLSKAFEGYNTCLFTYGQTGSGKSYTIMGHGEEDGIIPRFSEELFSRIENVEDKTVNINVEISFFEIYNEKIHDLLGSCKDKAGKKQTLKVREHPVLGPYVEGLSTYVVQSFDDIKGWINLGNKQRATAATGMNDKSSRSHSVFTIVLTQTRTENLEGDDHQHSITSKVNLIDLAGSERQSQANTTGDRFKEGASINKSLMTLGKVISLLSDRSTANKKKKLFIPYRDSVLTWLLKESLGGNSKTAMIATISPANLHVEETLSTLRYARQARNIVNQARVNEDPKAKIIRELKEEIERLRNSSGVFSEDVQAAGLAEIAMLKDALLAKEREIAEATRSWQEKLKNAEQRKSEEANKLEKAGISLQIDNKMPNLVNLNEDPQLSEMLLYNLREGQTRVGRMDENSTHDIQLNGALIADDHCVINNVSGILSVTPVGEAQTYVNGEVITAPTVLHHGDRVIIGGDHYFRFNHPVEVQRGKRSIAHQPGNQTKDFEFAKQELIRVQNAR